MKRKLILLLGIVLIAGAVSLALARPPSASAAPAVFASPIHAGCYLARHDQCKIHVESFTINLNPGAKMVYFALIAIQFPGGIQTKIYDWRPDQSNPAPSSGSTYTPSRVAKDFAATCGSTYAISLQGRDTLDASAFNLGLTGQFTCPTGTYLRYVAVVKK